jgi:hypothetical protein
MYVQFRLDFCFVLTNCFFFEVSLFAVYFLWGGFYVVLKFWHVLKSLLLLIVCIMWSRLCFSKFFEIWWSSIIEINLVESIHFYLVTLLCTLLTSTTTPFL